MLNEVLSAKSTSKAMPSAMRLEMQVALSAAYACEDFRQKLFEYFVKLTTAPPALAWNLIFCFLKETFDVAFIFVCKKLRGPAIEASKVHSKDDFNHYASHQVRSMHAVFKFVYFSFKNSFYLCCTNFLAGCSPHRWLVLKNTF